MRWASPRHLTPGWLLLAWEWQRRELKGRLANWERVLLLWTDHAITAAAESSLDLLSTLRVFHCEELSQAGARFQGDMPTADTSKMTCRESCLPSLALCRSQAITREEEGQRGAQACFRLNVDIYSTLHKSQKLWRERAGNPPHGQRESIWPLELQEPG